MKDAPVNTVRFFEAFDFMSAAETWLHAHKPRSVSAFRVRRPLGTCDALSRLMQKKNEKPNIQEGALRVVTAADFTAEVLASKQPVLVEFSTSWSRACHVMDSVLHALAAPKRTRGARASDTCEGKFKVVKVDADASLDLSLCYDIQSVPTLIYFLGGKPRLRIVGTASKGAILAKLKPFSE